MPTPSSPAEGLAKYATLPNLISAVRLGAAPLLIVWAAWGWAAPFLGLALVLLMTDWVDGRIARAWNLQSTFGARLDAASDVAIYACIAWGVWLLKPEEFWRERAGLIAVLGSYALSLAACLVKFHCLPNYHTRLAKASWFFVTVGVAALLLEISVWPMRLAFAAVTAANFESIAVTLALRRWRADIGSFLEALRQPDASAEAAGRPSAPVR